MWKINAFANLPLPLSRWCTHAAGIYTVQRTINSFISNIRNNLTIKIIHTSNFSLLSFSIYFFFFSIRVQCLFLYIYRARASICIELSNSVRNLKHILRVSREYLYSDWEAPQLNIHHAHHSLCKVISHVHVFLSIISFICSVSDWSFFYFFYLFFIRLLLRTFFFLSDTLMERKLFLLY